MVSKQRILHTYELCFCDLRTVFFVHRLGLHHIFFFLWLSQKSFLRHSKWMIDMFFLSIASLALELEKVVSCTPTIHIIEHQAVQQNTPTLNRTLSPFPTISQKTDVDTRRSTSTSIIRSSFIELKQTHNG